MKIVVLAVGKLRDRQLTALCDDYVARASRHVAVDVVEVEDDKVVLEIAEDVHIEVARKAVAQIVHPDTEPAEPDEDDAAGPNDDALPAEPEDGAEAAEPEPVREDKRWGGVFGRRE